MPAVCRHFKNYDGLVARPVRVHAKSRIGLGLFATRPYCAAELVMAFELDSQAEGQVLDWDSCERIHQERVTAVAPHWYFFPSTDHPLWYLNHSCNPNVGFRDWGNPGRSLTVPLVTLRKIHSGEHLTIDYSTMTTRDDGEEPGEPWTMQCFCGLRTCRRTITDFVNLPRRVRLAKVLTENPVSGVVPAFIVTECPDTVADLLKTSPRLVRRLETVLEKQIALSAMLEAKYSSKRFDPKP